MSLADFVRQSVSLRSVIGVLMISAPIAAWADDLPQGWSGKGQAGYVRDRGNTDTDSANAKLDMFYHTPEWKNQLTLEGLYGKSGQVTSAERWDIREQSDYTITSALFAFGALSYEDDRFSGFEYQESVSAGIGYKFFDSSTTKLAAQAGVGFRVLRPETLVPDVNGSGAIVARVPLDRESEAVGTAGIDFMHQFNASTKLTDKLLAESGSSNTSINNNIALQVNMSKQLALAVGYSWLHNTTPAAGVKKTDTITTMNIVYAFPKPAPTPAK